VLAQEILHMLARKGEKRLVDKIYRASCPFDIQQQALDG